MKPEGAAKSIAIVMVLSFSIIQWVAIPSAAFDNFWDFNAPIPAPPMPADALQSPPPPNCQNCCKACDVYAKTGALTEDVIDIVLPGTGPQLQINRTWNSNDPVSSLLGNGWTINFGRRLLPVTGKNGEEFVIFKMDNGREVKLQRNGSSYIRTDGAIMNFSLVDDGEGWELTGKDKTVTRYNQDGGIISITDPNGRSLTFEYDTVTTCLLRITNASGNYLDFTRNPNGKISRLVDNLGRQVVYNYDLSGNLTQVDYWDTASVTYTYNSTNLLTSYTNRSGQVMSTIGYKSTTNKVDFYTFRDDTFHFTYDTINDMTIKTDNHGRTWRFIYDNQGIRTVDENPLGFTIRRAPRRIEEALGYKLGYNVVSSVATNVTVRGASGSGRYYTIPGSQYYISSSLVSSPNMTTYTINYNAVEDAEGKITYYEFDRNGNLYAKLDSRQQVIEAWTYDVDNRVTSHTDENLLKTEFTYDEKGNILSKNYLLDSGKTATMEYAYDDKGNVTGVQLTDNSTNETSTTSYEYDSIGQLILSVGARNDTTLYTYDSFGRKISVRDPEGNEKRFEYDSRGNCIKEIFPDSSFIVSTFNKDNMLLSMTDRNNYTWRYDYDQWNRKVMEIGPLDDTLLYRYAVYSDRDNITASRDAMGRWTYYNYDDGGRMVREIRKVSDTSSVPDDDDIVTQISYYKNDFVKSIINSLGDSTKIEYDQANYISAITNEENEKISFLYDNFKNISGLDNMAYRKIRMTLPDGTNLEIIKSVTGKPLWKWIYGTESNDIVSEYVYKPVLTMEAGIAGLSYVPKMECIRGESNKLFFLDEYGNTIGIIDQIHKDTIRYSYNLNNQLIRMENDSNHTVEYGYNRNGYTEWQRTALGDTTRFECDHNGNLLAVVNQAQNSTVLNCDAYGHVLTVLYPDANSEIYTYTKDGKVATYTNKNDITTTFLYDAAGRLGKKTYSDGTPEDTFSYDRRNRLVLVANSSAQTSFIYDKAGRLTQTTQEVDGQSLTIEYEYDPAHNLVMLTYPNGRKITKKYNSRGLLDSLADESHWFCRVNYVFTPEQFSSTTNSWNTVDAVFESKGGRATRMDYSKLDGQNNYQPIVSFEMGYDKLGRKTSKRCNHFSTGSEAYGYDVDFQLKEYAKGPMNPDSTITFPTETQSWSFDSRGNWDTYYVNGTSQNRTHDNMNHIVSINATSLTYDNAGNLMSDGTNTYTWNAKNELIAANGTASYAYDALGRRVKKTVTGVTTVYVYDGLQMIYEKASNNIEKTFVFTTYIDEPFALFRKNGAVEDSCYYMHDEKYNVIALTNETGDIIERYEIGPYGECKIYTGAGADGHWFTTDDVQGIESIMGNEYLFQGRNRDLETGLYYYRARYYDPGLGRFISEDPIGLGSGDANFYRFCWNNSLFWLDPFGLCGWVYDGLTTERTKDERLYNSVPIHKTVNPIINRIEVIYAIGSYTMNDNQTVKMKHYVGEGQTLVKSKYLMNLLQSKKENSQADENHLNDAIGAAQGFLGDVIDVYKTYLKYMKYKEKGMDYFNGLLPPSGKWLQYLKMMNGCTQGKNACGK